MSVTRLRWRVFTRGWWGTGARDAQPEGTLRRAIGIAQIKTTELRSRNGSTVIANLDAHSVVRFSDRRYAGVGTELFVDGAIVVQTGLNGHKLSFVRMQPTVDAEDWLFVAGGGLAFKVSPFVVASQWGITPPPDGFTATANVPLDRVIDQMESAVTWTAVGCVLADEATIKQQGTSAMKQTVAAASTIGTATKSITVDLDAFAGPVDSPDEDFISVWVRVDNPANVAALQLAFDVGAGNFATDYYTRDVVPSEQRTAPDQLSAQTQGIGGYVYSPNAGETVAILGPEVPGGPRRLFTVSQDGGLGHEVNDPAVLAELQGATTQSFIPVTLDTWTLVRLPKSTFNRVGASAATWANVVAVRLTMTTNAGGAAIAYWDDLKLHGGVGLQGTYKYKVAYLNEATGTRSNGNPTPVVVDNVNRGGVTVTRLPTSSDPQVTHTEVFRTVGNGTLMFRVAKLPTGTLTFVDEVADAAGINSNPDATLMSDIELPLDNTRPDDAWECAFGPFDGRMLWTRSPRGGERGRVFFSPAGRAEAVEGFVTVSSDDEPVLVGVIFNAAAYVWTTVGVYQLQGSQLTPRRVFGVPGTLWPLSLAITPYGVAYLALDGPRLFDGASSKLIAPDAVALLFRNEAVEDVVFLT